ncbi:MAG: YigZ family protein [Cytophagales bacterium]
MAPDVYRSILKQGEGLYKEKGSKFIGHAMRVDTEKEFKEAIEKLQQKYHDARHVCYALRIGIKNEFIAKSDDGEPMHSAADPILGQIISADLVNVAVFVVRYFGGTKLGVGGLKHAYKTAALEAINKAQIKEFIISEEFKIYFNYSNSSHVMKLIADFEAVIIDQQYDEKCYLKVELRRSLAERFISKMRELEYLGIRLDLKE